jgi:hypothetical protein
MTDTPTPATGADLARQALNAYKASRAPSGQSGPGRKNRSRTRRTDRTGGRDPIGFGALLTQLGAEQGWTASLDGGSLIDRWADLCPTALVDHVQPVAYDPESGRLDLRPGSHTYAAQLRVLGGQLAKHINDRAGRTMVRTIRVLPVGTVTAPAAAVDAGTTTPGVPETPVRTRETASPGYQRALAVARAHKPERDQLLDERIRAAVAASDAWLADPRNRQPEADFPDAVDALERAAAAAGPEPGTLEASIAAALRYKHHGEGLRAPRRLFEAL